MSQEKTIRFSFLVQRPSDVDVNVCVYYFFTVGNMSSTCKCKHYPSWADSRYNYWNTSTHEFVIHELRPRSIRPSTNS